MPGDPFYGSRDWQKKRAAILRACGGRCAIAGCRHPARHVDHRISRRQRPDLALDDANLVPLCHPHHNAKTNRVDGGFGHARRDAADPYAGLHAKGCDASGIPTDPNHPWNRGRT